jgi:hypothetical protein
MASSSGAFDFTGLFSDRAAFSLGATKADV